MFDLTIQEITELPRLCLECAEPWFADCPDCGVNKMYSLWKEDKSVGDSGGMSMALSYDDNGEVKYEQDARPRVGVHMRVGSTYARSMHHQDWWQTNIITEILEETEKTVKFKTKSGSIYEWSIR